MKTKYAYIQLFIALFAVTSYGQFSTGHLVVLQAGDGTLPLSGTGNTIVFREFSPSGVSGFSMAVPSTGTNALVIRGSSSSEGYLSRSEDGKYLVFGAYRQNSSNTITLNSSTPSSIARAVGLVDGNGQFILAATSTLSSHAAGDIRAAAATGSNHVWANSSSQGTSYYGSGFAASSVQTAKPNVRALQVFNNRLYLSSQVTSGNPSDAGILTVGSSTPVSSAQTLSTCINTGVGSVPGQFYFHPMGNICYIADGRNGNSGGGLQKWVNSAGSWSLAYTLSTGTVGAFGVVVNFSGIYPLVYATTAESSNNRLTAIIDLGAGSTFTNLAFSGNGNSIFRGLAFAPSTSTCVPVSINTVVNSSPACANQSVSLSVNASGTGPLSYTWTQPITLASVNSASVILSGFVPGIYTVMAANACGTAATITSVTAYPVPSLQVQSATLCLGNSITLQAQGANSYTWSSVNNGTLMGNGLTVNPQTNTTYTVTGTSTEGCVASASLELTVINNIQLQMRGDTICAGQTATIAVQGANSYTWNNGINSNSMAVSPGATTTYTVLGSIPGCTVTAVDSLKVLVHPLPQIQFNLSSVFCLEEDSLLIEPQPPGGILVGSGLVGQTFYPPGTGNYTFHYQYTDTIGCASAASHSLQVSTCLMTTESTKHKTWKIYPNPVREFLYLEADPEEGGCIELYAGDGSLVMEIQIVFPLHVIPVKQLKAGTYVIRLRGPNPGQFRFVKW